jgi:hypothetical protein
MLNHAIQRCVTIGAIVATIAFSGQQPANARDEASRTNKEKVRQLNRGELLAAAKTWMYQIDELDTSGAVEPSGIIPRREICPIRMRTKTGHRLSASRGIASIWSAVCRFSPWITV